MVRLVNKTSIWSINSIETFNKNISETNNNKTLKMLLKPFSAAHSLFDWNRLPSVRLSFFIAAPLFLSSLQFHLLLSLQGQLSFFFCSFFCLLRSYLNHFFSFSPSAFCAINTIFFLYILFLFLSELVSKFLFLSPCHLSLLPSLQCCLKHVYFLWVFSASSS